MNKEKKFETVSEFIESKAKPRFNLNELPYILLSADDQFINKDYLKEKINLAIDFVNKYNTQTMLGPVMLDEDNYSLPIDAITKDGQKQFIKALKSVLKLLEE